MLPFLYFHLFHLGFFLWFFFRWKPLRLNNEASEVQVYNLVPDVLALLFGLARDDDDETDSVYRCALST